MNFQDLLIVEKADSYLDVAFRRGKERVASLNLKKYDATETARRSALERIGTMNKSLVLNMRKITTSFPNIENLPEFYYELIKTQLDYPTLKKSLGAVNWADGKANDFTKEYMKKIRYSHNKSEIIQHLKEYYGRLASVFKRINKNLEYLEESRKIMKKFPAVKTSLPTVALYGFPNVGKTTILKKLTGSKAEVKNYSFTTTIINIGYINTTHTKIQVLDTPGTLARVDKMNDIEMQAELALKYCADTVVFVYDPTYDLVKQNELLAKVIKRHNRRKDILIYVSKLDLVKDFKLDKEYISDIKVLKDELKKIVK